MTVTNIATMVCEASRSSHSGSHSSSSSDHILSNSELLDAGLIDVDVFIEQLLPGCGWPESRSGQGNSIYDVEI